MTMNKKSLLSAAVIFMLSGTSATAEMNVELNLGGPAYTTYPTYISPYPTYYDPGHRGHDARYWHEHAAHRPQGHGGHEEYRGGNEGHEHR